jgi:hypothetical protein
VRAQLHHLPDAPPDVAAALAGRLAERYPQYRDRPFTGLLVLRVVDLTGWSAGS